MEEASGHSMMLTSVAAARVAVVWVQVVLALIAGVCTPSCHLI